MKRKSKSIVFILIVCFSLGLAPFYPEPHLWGKIKWLIGGANGMTLKDYFDLLLHGTPWLILAYYLFKKG